MCSALDKCDRESRHILYDARGISCGYVCDNCIEDAKKRYRPEIFTDSNYETTEEIDDDY